MTSQEAAVRGLAIVGFIALVALGIWLAIYSARFVPGAVSRLNAAAVSLSSIFQSAPPNLTVVPGIVATSTLPFGESDATSTPPISTPKPTNSVVKAGTGITPVAGQETKNTYQVGSGTTTPPTLHGLPDLTSAISVAGYLMTTATDSFVASTTIPRGMRPAVKFAIKNIGTNVARAGWRFSASIPAQSGYIFFSQPQQALNPGDSIEYTLGFDQATPGSNQTITISPNFDRTLAEFNTNNNSASVNLVILGS